MRNTLRVWTLYDHPTDFPDCFVARLFMGENPTQWHYTAPTLDALRAKLPPGLTVIPRSPGDDPVIVECWL